MTSPYLNASGANYASASDVALLKAQVGALQHDLKVHENGYLVLFREHERDIRLLFWAVRGLVVLVCLQAIALALVVLL